MAAEKNVPLVPQGGNTSMVGGATPPADGSALILSLRRMNRIRSISPENNLAICEAGVIMANLHEAAPAVDCRFPLSLGATGSHTIEALVSTTHGGTLGLSYSSQRSVVDRCKRVMSHIS